MPSIKVAPLREDLAFGARISGVNHRVLAEDAIRRQLNQVFEDRGLIVFEDVEPTGQMHLAISNVFGQLKEHPVASVPRVDQDTMPGVIDMRYDAETGGIVEVDGKQLAQWLPWHFDHCYNNELNRAGVLRAIDIPPDGGMTGFADGVGLYNAIRSDLREKIEGKNLIYTLDLRYSQMRFGKPKTFRNVRSHPTEMDVVERAKTLPRAIHPAVWTRKSGEKVLHVSPWMAVGIEGHEDPDGEALLDAVCQEMIAKVQPYFHKWQHTDMLIWDNWRMLHSVSGHAPQYTRRMQRTTIKGDYGLGYFENDGQNNGKGNTLLEMTV